MDLDTDTDDFDVVARQEPTPDDLRLPAADIRPRFIGGSPFRHKYHLTAAEVREARLTHVRGGTEQNIPLMQARAKRGQDIFSGAQLPHRHAKRTKCTSCGKTWPKHIDPPRHYVRRDVPDPRTRCGNCPANWKGHLRRAPAHDRDVQALHPTRGYLYMKKEPCPSTRHAHTDWWRTLSELCPAKKHEHTTKIVLLDYGVIEPARMDD